MKEMGGCFLGSFRLPEKHYTNQYQIFKQHQTWKRPKSCFAAFWSSSFGDYECTYVAMCNAIICLKVEWKQICEQICQILAIYAKYVL